MWSPRVEKSRDWLTEGVAFTIRRETIYMQREKSKTLHIKYTKIREHQTVMNRKTFNLLCDVDGEEKMCFCESVNAYWLGLLVYMEMYVVIIMQLIQSVGPTRRKQDPSNNDDGMRWFRSKTFRQKIQIISTSHMVAVRWRWSSKKKPIKRNHMYNCWLFGLLSILSSSNVIAVCHNSNHIIIASPAVSTNHEEEYRQKTTQTVDYKVKANESNKSSHTKTLQLHHTHDAVFILIPYRIFSHL